jgi:hypothetical protein
MINLVWRQLIGFEMRRLPGIDRCVMAQGIYYVIEQKEALARSYNLRNGGAASAFPTTLSDDSLDGLGGDFSVHVGGGVVCLVATEGVRGWGVGNLCRTKTSNLQNLCSHTPNINRARV